MFFSTLPLLFCQPVLLVFFPIFLFGKLFVGCQRCSGSPPLPVARNTGLPFTTRSWLHRFPIHHQLLATQGPFIAVASYTGFPFVIKGQTDRVPFHCQWLATMGFHLSAKTCYMYTQGSHYQQWLATQVSHLLLVAIHSGFNLLPAASFTWFQFIAKGYKIQLLNAGFHLLPVASYAELLRTLPVASYVEFPFIASSQLAGYVGFLFIASCCSSYVYTGYDLSLIPNRPVHTGTSVRGAVLILQDILLQWNFHSGGNFRVGISVP